MRFMLSATHATLLQSLRDVHAAESQLSNLRILHLQEQLESARAMNQALDVRLKMLAELVVSQQQTIKTAMSDLVILKGAGRVRTAAEQAPEPKELQPDIEITDAPTDIEDRNKLIRDAQVEYDRVLAELEKEVDVSRVTPAAIAAAIPESPEAWRQEHEPVPDESMSDLVPRG